MVYPAPREEFDTLSAIERVLPSLVILLFIPVLMGLMQPAPPTPPPPEGKAEITNFEFALG
jgi:hypothetical protein